MQNKHNHLGPMPKVGIRPVIDARLGGVRESLEDTTMEMAKRVAKLISENLKYYTGDPVECVISDTTIGRVPEAQRCEEKFLKEGSKLKAFVFFKGRSIIYKDQGQILLLRLATDLEEYGKVEAMPVLEGKRMIMFIAPKKKK